jgi:hypothetical protein
MPARATISFFPIEKVKILAMDNRFSNNKVNYL